MEFLYNFQYPNISKERVGQKIDPNLWRGPQPPLSTPGQNISKKVGGRGHFDPPLSFDPKRAISEYSDFLALKYTDIFLLK